MGAQAPGDSRTRTRTLTRTRTRSRTLTLASTHGGEHLRWQAPLVSAIVFNQLFGPPALKYALRAARENGQQGADDETKVVSL